MLSIKPFFINENAAEDAKASGKMVAFFMPEQIGEYIQGLFRDEPGDSVLPPDMHITLGLVRDEDDEKIKKALSHVAQKIPRFLVRIRDFDTFPPHNSNDNKHVLWAKPDAKLFDAVHKLLFKTFDKHGIEIDNGSHDFKPHITVKYCDKKPNLKDKRVDHKAIVDKIAFAIGNEKHFFPLKRK